jgi:hypothetical protein
MSFFRTLKSRCSDRSARHLVRAFGLLTIFLFVIMASATAQTSQSIKLPSFDLVTKALTQYFALLNYKVGDLVSQSHVADAIAHVTGATGWEVPDRKAIAQRALADNSFLVVQLSTPEGRSFMRTIAKYPGAYSRLDQLSTVSGGQKVVKELMAEKGGSQMIEYLATTRGGHELGKMMAGAQHGVDLNKPTGRIYTADDLLVELKRIYAHTKK